MTVDQMRKKITDAYSNSIGWRRRVARMADNQVVAIYHNCEKRGMFDKNSNGRRCKQLSIDDILASKVKNGELVYCKYYKPSFSTLLGYCSRYKQILENTGYDPDIEYGYLLTDEEILTRLELIIEKTKGEEYELGVLICNGYLEMSIEERAAFNEYVLGYDLFCECNDLSDCKHCVVLSKLEN